MTATLCLLAVAAFFVIRVLLIRARRRRQEATSRAQLRYSIHLARIDAEQARERRNVNP